MLARSSQTCSPESGNGNRMLPDSGDSCLFALRNFFVQAKYWKVFSRKSFFLKLISSKIFYNRNHFTSKQTEHKKKLKTHKPKKQEKKTKNKKKIKSKGNQIGKKKKKKKRKLTSVD
jgi:hypothetical protein